MTQLARRFAPMPGLSQRPLLVTQVVAVALALAACAAPVAPSRSTTGSDPQQPNPAVRTGTKTITIGFSSTVQAMGIMGATTTSGGWQSLNEIHSNALVTADT